MRDQRLDGCEKGEGTKGLAETAGGSEMRRRCRGRLRTGPVPGSGTRGLVGKWAATRLVADGCRECVQRVHVQPKKGIMTGLIPRVGGHVTMMGDLQAYLMSREEWSRTCRAAWCRVSIDRWTREEPPV